MQYSVLKNGKSETCDCRFGETFVTLVNFLNDRFMQASKPSGHRKNGCKKARIQQMFSAKSFTSHYSLIVPEGSKEA